MAIYLAPLPQQSGSVRNTAVTQYLRPKVAKVLKLIPALKSDGSIMESHIVLLGKGHLLYKDAYKQIPFKDCYVSLERNISIDGRWIKDPKITCDQFTPYSRNVTDSKKRASLRLITRNYKHGQHRYNSKLRRRSVVKDECNTVRPNGVQKPLVKRTGTKLSKKNKHTVTIYKEISFSDDSDEIIQDSDCESGNLLTLIPEPTETVQCPNRKSTEKESISVIPYNELEKDGKWRQLTLNSFFSVRNCITKLSTISEKLPHDGFIEKSQNEKTSVSELDKNVDTHGFVTIKHEIKPLVSQADVIDDIQAESGPYIKVEQLWDKGIDEQLPFLVEGVGQSYEKTDENFLSRIKVEPCFKHCIKKSKPRLFSIYHWKHLDTTFSNYPDSKVSLSNLRKKILPSNGRNQVRIRIIENDEPKNKYIYPGWPFNEKLKGFETSVDTKRLHDMVTPQLNPQKTIDRFEALTQPGVLPELVQYLEEIVSTSLNITITKNNSQDDHSSLDLDNIFEDILSMEEKLEEAKWFDAEFCQLDTDFMVNLTSLMSSEDFESTISDLNKDFQQEDLQIGHAFCLEPV